jgi:hypothetical protein
MSDESAWYPDGDWSPDAGWYEITSGPTLRQCDILMRCPVLRLTGKLQWPVVASDAQRAYFEMYDSINLTQSCDLENQKVEDV